MQVVETKHLKGICNVPGSARKYLEKSQMRWQRHLKRPKEGRQVNKMWDAKEREKEADPGRYGITTLEGF